MVTFELQRFFVIIQHLSVFISSNTVQTLLIILVWTNCSLVSDVLEGTVQCFFRGNESHEVFNRTDGSRRHVKSVVPQSISGCSVILFILNSLLFSFYGSLFFLFFSRVPEIGIDSRNEDEDEWSSELSRYVVTGPSLLTALAMCSKTNPGFLAFIIPLSSALNLRLHFLYEERGTSRCEQGRS